MSAMEGSYDTRTDDVPPMIFPRSSVIHHDDRGILSELSSGEPWSAVAMRSPVDSDQAKVYEYPGAHAYPYPEELIFKTKVPRTEIFEKNAVVGCGSQFDDEVMPHHNRVVIGFHAMSHPSASSHEPNALRQPSDHLLMRQVGGETDSMSRMVQNVGKVRDSIRAVEKHQGSHHGHHVADALSPKRRAAVAADKHARRPGSLRRKKQEQDEERDEEIWA